MTNGSAQGQAVARFEVDLSTSSQPAEGRRDAEDEDEEGQQQQQQQQQQQVQLSVSERDIQSKENKLHLDDTEVKLVREILFSKINLGDFDKKEIERFSNDDHQIRRYARLGQDRLSTLYRTAACVRAAMEWRKSVTLSQLVVDNDLIGQLNDNNNQLGGDGDGDDNKRNGKLLAAITKVHTSGFSEEILQPNRNNAYISGKTLLGENIMWFRVAGHKRQYFNEEFKKYLAYQLERIDAQSNQSGFIICIDCTNAGTSNIDLEFANYFTKSILHFRGNLRYVLVLNMGWLLSAAWKIIKSWLPQEQRDHVKMASKKELNQFMTDDQLPVYNPL